MVAFPITFFRREWSGHVACDVPPQTPSSPLAQAEEKYFQQFWRRVAGKHVLDKKKKMNIFFQ